jgi:hypothetical protein
MPGAAKFAVGKRALGICDVCSFRYLLSELRTTTVRGRPTHILACPTCWDKDHEQNFLADVVHADAEALREARPEDFYASRILPHWRPSDAFLLSLALGEVEVLTP